ncbi:hypothetical protein AB838_22110 [Rhodobacteraceae bacterium (ex Bugula neritina AB1)]|nr:hypothetical protein AB838_22110 [Rhodobacteraceae bacterium (ex Bugula neritina AB1)]
MQIFQLPAATDAVRIDPTFVEMQAIRAGGLAILCEREFKSNSNSHNADGMDGVCTQPSRIAA